MQTRLQLAPGETRTGIVTDFLVAGIRVENPSGGWFRITPANLYVPPNTLGFTADIIPAQRAVDITFLSIGPDGSVSDASGLPLDILLTDAPIGNNAGDAYARLEASLANVAGKLDTLDATMTALIAAVDAQTEQIAIYDANLFGFVLNSTWQTIVGPVLGTPSAIVPAQGFGKRITVVRLVVALRSNAPNIMPNGVSTVEFYTGQGAGAVRIGPSISVSPEQPTVILDLTPNSMRTNSNQALSTWIYSEGEDLVTTGSQRVDVFVGWYT